MLSSSAYRRMRAESPSEFEPKSIFFTYDEEIRIDWRNSLRVKAALVYEEITGHHVNSQTMPIASRLLLDLAKSCHRLIQNPGIGAESAQSDQAVRAEGSQDRGPNHQTKENEGIQKTEEEKRNEEIKIEDEIMKLSTGQKRVADGIFLVVGFLRRLKSEIDKKKIRESVDDYYISKHTQEIITDVIKIENQLPLEQIIHVVQHIENTIKEVSQRRQNKDTPDSLGKFSLNFTIGNLHEIIHSFCWYYSPFYSKETTPHEDFKKKLSDPKTTLLDLLHFSLVPHISAERAGASGETSRIPFARQLKRSGVRFETKEGGSAEIEFEEPTLRMPALIYDFKLATVARNLLARECVHEEQRKPITRYFQLMNELVGDIGDVKILKRAGVIRGGSRRGQDVLGLLKKIDGYATYPSVFVAMDQQIKKVNDFHNTRMKSFFVRNRPGVIWASSVAAVSVVALLAARKKRG